MDNLKGYGLLMNQDAKLHRDWFIEMTSLIGFTCPYYAPKDSREFNLHGDLETDYKPPVDVGYIFDGHPDQKTLKKMGWVSELGESSYIIHLPYDTPDLQKGCLIEVPSGIDGAPNRLFRIITISNIMVYPASVACEIAPEYTDTAQKNEIIDFTKTDFNVLVDSEDDD